MAPDSQLPSAGSREAAAGQDSCPPGQAGCLQQRRPDRQERGCPSLRVLIIEDNRDAAETLCDLLALFGHQTEIAHSGTDGLALARDRRPDVVLCDIGLPEMDGYAVARELRSDPLTAPIRLVALTGYGRDADRHEAAAAGFDLHLVKPVGPEVLRRLLEGFAKGGQRFAGPGDLQPEG
jgi:CheY-like chemotaxis protein